MPGKVNALCLALTGPAQALATAPAKYRQLGPGQPQVLAQFTGGAWTPDGSWFGGSLGAYGKDGQLRGPGVPQPRRVPDVLVAPGPRPELISVCDWLDGRERALGEVRSYGWAGERELYSVSGQALHRRSFPDGAAQTVALPEGLVPTAVAAAGGWLFVGTGQGAVYKLQQR